MPCNGPVSYTHLDVYKRQVPDGEAAWGVAGDFGKTSDINGDIIMHIDREDMLELTRRMTIARNCFNRCLLYTSQKFLRWKQQNIQSVSV